MGYLLLILGIALWIGGHLFKRLVPAKRAAMGDKGKGLVAVALLAAIVLMVIGYRSAALVTVWVPPSFMIHISNLLVLIGFWFFALSGVAGTMSARVRHKQLTGVKSWAVGHLLVNGDLASILLFGGMLFWAVLSVILINKAEPTWERPANPSVKNDAIAFGVALVLYGIVALIHTWLGYYPFPVGGA
ncbi:NnrU family protein in cluster with Mesaconyl-CoA hydratase [Roseibacterium elongatum DSM 19469]|uniref:NnrU family protein in cluster with Mesaconyl-CoA hydratase n=1 Tax=Roseicyclus elongatus DSM 19469 TaxID=1294273 RepID=W8RSJ5_9RHOB|nr:NnrU family protein [Roseibacterium elongatum]AHM04093.1 NnrU family protein in cluster with Mesaconyl-CoA hydratase [Roseibacterium elongatum DSM 19469]